MKKKTLYEVLAVSSEDGSQALVELRLRCWAHILKTAPDRLMDADKKEIAAILQTLAGDEALRRKVLGHPARRRGKPSKTMTRDLRIASDYLQLKDAGEKTAVAERILAEQYGQTIAVIQKAIKEYRGAAQRDIELIRCAD